MAPASKTALRERLRAARRRLGDDVRAAEARMLSHHLEPVASGAGTGCAYVAVGTEPGSVELLDTLLRRAGRVLLPVARTTTDDVPLPLQWGEYRPDRLIAGRWELREAAEPWLPAPALRQAEPGLGS